MFDLSLFVKSGDELTAELWDKLWKAGRATRILFGNGIRGRRTPDGVLLSCSLWAPWPHPFKVGLSGSTATIAKGLVNLVEPVIKKVPISGTTTQAQPTLDLSSPVLDSSGNGWIALEATLDKTTLVPSTVEVVQVSSLLTTDRLKHRHPLAVLQKQSSGVVSLFQVEMFNVTLVGYPDVNTNAIRYFVFPA